MAAVVSGVDMPTFADFPAIHQAKRRRQAGIPAGSAEPALLECASTQDWVRPVCDEYRGLLVRRTPTWDPHAIQPCSDFLYEHFRDAFAGVSDRFFQSVPATGDPSQLSSSLSRAARQLIAPLLEDGLPGTFGEQLTSDCLELGMVVARMLPGAKELVLKIEIVKDNACFRWHQDNYVARALCTYSCCGTECVHHDHVDLWELDHCGRNAHVVREPSQVRSIDVGDLLFIKGKKFPGAAAGLVHRSPDCRHHPDGRVMTRLCLKVDVY